MAAEFGSGAGRRRPALTERRDEDPFRAVFRSARDAMLIADDEGRYVEANPAACRLLQRSRQELLSMSLFDVSPSDVDAEGAWRTFLERGEMSGEYVLTRADGSTVDVEFRATANILPGLHLSIMRDITARKELERERAAMQKELQRAQRVESLGVLATGVAHDFNTIMAKVRGHAELVRIDLRPGAHPSLGEIDEAVDRAMEVTRRLLAFGRQQDLDPRPVHVNEVVHHVRPLIEPLLGPEIELVVDLLDDEDASVVVDPHIEQVLLNLVANARDAMVGGGQLAISTDVCEIGADASSPDVAPGRYAVLVVSDDGIGMDPETRERALDPFFTTKTSWSPSGLGLSSAYGLVTQMGGTINLESDPGVGTTVTILLPTVDDRGSRMAGSEVRGGQ